MGRRSSCNTRKIISNFYCSDLSNDYYCNWGTDRVAERSSSRLGGTHLLIENFRCEKMLKCIMILQFTLLIFVAQLWPRLHTLVAPPSMPAWICACMDSFRYLKSLHLHGPKRFKMAKKGPLCLRMVGRSRVRFCVPTSKKKTRANIWLFVNTLIFCHRG